MASPADLKRSLPGSMPKSSAMVPRAPTPTPIRLARSAWAARAASSIRLSVWLSRLSAWLEVTPNWSSACCIRLSAWSEVTPNWSSACCIRLSAWSMRVCAIAAAFSASSRSRLIFAPLAYPSMPAANPCAAAPRPLYPLRIIKGII